MEVSGIKVTVFLGKRQGSHNDFFFSSDSGGTLIMFKK